MSARHGRRPLMPALASRKWLRIADHKFRNQHKRDHGDPLFGPSYYHWMRWLQQSDTTRSRWRP